MDHDNMRSFIFEVYKSYETRKQNNNLYIDDDYIPQNIIKMYNSLNNKYPIDQIISEFKQKYIYDESLIEKNISILDRQGLGEVYDFINQFDCNHNNFSLYIIFKFHQLLYCHYPHPEFGGAMRTMNVFIGKNDFEIPTADMIPNRLADLSKDFNDLMQQNDQHNIDILEYINESVRITTEIMKIQPFFDGNKRSSRGLLNLMFKKAGLPPIFINYNEHDSYKKALENALTTGDYTSLNRLYYYKIVDSIIDFDIQKDLINPDIDKNDHYGK